MLAPRARLVGFERDVRRGGVELGARPQRRRGDLELGRVPAVAARGREEGPPVGEVHRPPVVGVDQREVGGLAALVDVGDARHHQLHELLAEGVHPGVLVEPLGERGDRGPADVDRPRGEVADALLVRGVRRHPGDGGLGLSGRLVQVVAEALDADRPGRHEVLPGEVVELGIEGDLLRPARHRLRPLAGKLGQDGEAGADVLRALGVVRGERGHRVRRHAGAERVELRRGDAEAVGLAADLVQAGQRVPAVQRGVLHALGHDRTAGLLEADDGLGGAGQDQLGRPGHRVGIGVPGRLRGGRADQPQGLGRRLLAGDRVGPVDRHRREQLDHGLAQLGHVPGEPVDLAAEELRQDLLLRLITHDVVIGGESGVLEERADQRPGTRRIDEQPGDHVERVVPGRAVARPVVRQPLVVDEDLLRDRPHRGQLAQPGQVGARIGQPVGMVDPQPGDDPLRHQRQDHPVGGVEDLGVLDAEPDEGRHVEEPPVAGALTPRHQPVELVVQPPAAALPYGELVVVVAQHVTVGHHLGLDVGVAAEHGHRDLAAGPVEVEPPRRGRLGAVLQDLPEPGVGRLGDGHGHVVRHDVGDQGESPGRELAQARDAAELLPDLRVVGHVVAVERGRHRLQDRREVEVAHPQLGEVADQAGRLPEPEVRGELQPVGRRGIRGSRGFGRPGPHGRRGLHGFGHVVSSECQKGMPWSRSGTA